MSTFNIICTTKTNTKSLLVQHTRILSNDFAITRESVYKIQREQQIVFAFVLATFNTVPENGMYT